MQHVTSVPYLEHVVSAVPPFQVHADHLLVGSVLLEKDGEQVVVRGVFSQNVWASYGHTVHETSSVKRSEDVS